jgi:hypothetical protein
MSSTNKIILFIGLVVIFLSAGIVIFFIVRGQKAGPQQQPVWEVPSPTASIGSTTEMKTWTDNENGITFQYPPGFTVAKMKDPASVDAMRVIAPSSVNYIALKIQEPPNAYTLKEWLPTYKEASRAASVTGVTVGGERASQYVFANPSTSLRVTAMFHDGVMYLFEGNSDNGGILDKAYDTFLSTFTFLPSPSPVIGAGAGEAGGGNVEYEEEEVVE